MKRFLPYYLMMFVLMTSSCQEEPSSETTSSSTSSSTTTGESKEYSNDPSEISVTGGYQTDFNLSKMKGYANLTPELKAGAKIGIEYSKYSDMTNPTKVTVTSLNADNSYSIELRRVNIGTKLYYRSFVQYIASGFYEYGEIRSFVWRTVEIPQSGAVDLGLSVKWAACDLGTSSPTNEYGDYYAWGETTPKTNFTKSNYKYYSNNKYTKYNATDRKQVLDLSDDAAHERLGGKWRIPTRRDFEELTNALNSLCTKDDYAGAPNNTMKCYSQVMYKNTEGRLYINQDPRYSNIAIFTPEDTYYIMKNMNENKSGARTWCSNTHHYYYNLLHGKNYYFDDEYIDFCYFNTYDITGGFVERWMGLRIRPVWDDKLVEGQGQNSQQDEDKGNEYDKPEEVAITGSENGHTWVDLGLSVKWANCNIGATTPEGYGNYYAWGETTTKTDYDWDTYHYCKGDYNKMTKYCVSSTYGVVDNKTTLELTDDAAHVNWKGEWRMPTYDEYKELCDNCTWEWTKISNVYGYKVTGKKKGYTGSYIFLPAAGNRNGLVLENVGERGEYWLSSLYENISSNGWWFVIKQGGHGTYREIRLWGKTIRAVCDI